MAKFTKLNIGDSVASSGGRVWKKLSAESVNVADLIGTWTLSTKSYSNLDCSMLVLDEIYTITFAPGNAGTYYAMRNSGYNIVVYNKNMSGSNLLGSPYVSNVHIWVVSEVPETDPVKLLAIKQFLEVNGTKS